MWYRGVNFSTYSVMRSLWCGFVRVRYEHHNPFKPASNAFVFLTFSFCIELARAVFVSSRFLLGFGGGTCLLVHGMVCTQLKLKAEFRTIRIQIVLKSEIQRPPPPWICRSQACKGASPPDIWPPSGAPFRPLKTLNLPHFTWGALNYGTIPVTRTIYNTPYVSEP